MDSELLVSEFNFPSAYEVLKHKNYQGVVSSYFSFFHFRKDALYQFPLIDTMHISSEPRAQVSFNLLTFTQNISISHTLQLLHASSPFKKSSSLPDIFKGQESNEAPINSIATSIEDNFVKCTDKGESTTGFLEVPQFPRRSITPSIESSRPGLDSFEKNAIRDIHLRYIAKGKDNLYSSITPNNSYLDAQGDRTGKSIENEVELNSHFSIKLSRVSSICEDITENWGSIIAPRMSEAEERFISPSIVLERTMSIDYGEECFSFVEEGVVQAVKDFNPSESPASKNLLLSSKFRWEVGIPNPNSPILRKMVICESPDISEPSLYIIASICLVGFTSALSLEYSNIEAVNKACIDYHKEAFTTKSLFSEKVVLSLSKLEVMYLSCGFEHCALVTARGKVMTWGYGSSGCLGHGSILSSNHPKEVADIKDDCVVYLECGGYHTVAVTEIGEAIVWGRGDVHQLGLAHRQLCKDEMGYVAFRPCKLSYFSVRGLKLKAVACGESHTLLLDSEGKIFSFGWGQHGQLGVHRSQLTPQLMTQEIVCVKTLQKKAIKISAGSIFSACLNEAGEVWVWGSGAQGELGLGPSVKKSEEPVKVEGINEFIVDIVCGENYMICVAASGRVLGWGQGRAGIFSSQDKNFPVGTEIICSFPKILGETDIAHHFVVQNYSRNIISSQEYHGIVNAMKHC